MKKNILYISIVVSFIVISAFAVSGISRPKLYLDPLDIMDKKLKPGDTFTVNVNVDEVTDLKGYEFRLRYNTDVLDATDVTASDFLSSSPYCIKRVIDDSKGYIWVACMKSFSKGVGVSGSGTLETITFKVIDKGESKLDLYRTVFGDQEGTSISHDIEDGYFQNHKIKKDRS